METKEFREVVQKNMVELRRLGLPYYNNGENNEHKKKFEEKLANHGNLSRLFTKEALWFTDVIMNKQGLKKIDGSGITEAWPYSGGCFTGAALHIEDHKLPR